MTRMTTPIPTSYCLMTTSRFEPSKNSMKIEPGLSYCCLTKNCLTTSRFEPSRNSMKKRLCYSTNCWK